MTRDDSEYVPLPNTLDEAVGEAAVIKRANRMGFYVKPIVRRNVDRTLDRSYRVTNMGPGGYVELDSLQQVIDYLVAEQAGSNIYDLSMIACEYNVSEWDAYQDEVRARYNEGEHGDADTYWETARVVWQQAERVPA
jgi:hypothetical protein